jgi:hypothetical protein
MKTYRTEDGSLVTIPEDDPVEVTLMTLVEDTLGTGGAHPARWKRMRRLAKIAGVNLNDVFVEAGEGLIDNVTDLPGYVAPESSK